MVTATTGVHQGFLPSEGIADGRRQVRGVQAAGWQMLLEHGKGEMAIGSDTDGATHFRRILGCDGRLAPVSGVTRLAGCAKTEVTEGTATITMGSGFASIVCQEGLELTLEQVSAWSKRDRESSSAVSRRSSATTW